jgi:hypothetical protein
MAMTFFRWGPLIVLMGLFGLSFIGSRLPSVNSFDHVQCAYAFAQIDRPAADVLILGTSRVGFAYDPAYIMDRLKNTYGVDRSVERIALNMWTVPQFRPLADRYITHRGAPKHVVVQLVYNRFRHRQRTIDLPINNERNLNNATFEQMRNIEASAIFNTYDTLLPRTFEAGYRTSPALALEKLQADFYNAIRYWPKRLSGGLSVCNGDQLYRQSLPAWLYNSLNDDISFTETETQKAARLRMLDLEPQLSFDPTDDIRVFEVDQTRHLIAQFQDAGSIVHILILPELGVTQRNEVFFQIMRETFPGVEILDAFDVFDTAEGQNLEHSYSDPVHVRKYGALLLSRDLAQDIADMDF